MDPNANLAEQRKLHRKLARKSLSEADCLECLERLQELAQEMDEWLTRGGFLPKDWQGPNPGSTSLRRS